jgi:hypothetical protein
MDPVAALPAPPPAIVEPRSKAAVEAFEALLIGELASLMLGTVETDGRFGGGHAETIYRGMMAEHLGNAVVRRGGLGLAPALMDEVIRLQGGRP